MHRVSSYGVTCVLWLPGGVFFFLWPTWAHLLPSNFFYISAVVFSIVQGIILAVGARSVEPMGFAKHIQSQFFQFLSRVLIGAIVSFLPASGLMIGLTYLLGGQVIQFDAQVQEVDCRRPARKCDRIYLTSIELNLHGRICLSKSQCNYNLVGSNVHVTGVSNSLGVRVLNWESAF